jgi:hypothetical protein
MGKSVNDLTGILPYLLQEKTRTYLDYVNDRLDDLLFLDKFENISQKQRNDILMVFFIRYIYGFITFGFSNLHNSLNFFEERKLVGFQIGSTYFSKDSEIISEWNELSNKLSEMIKKNHLEFYVKSQKSIDDLLVMLVFDLNKKFSSDDFENLL